MSVTANLYCNLSAWANQSHGNCVSAGGNAYRCVFGGTAPTTPSGTATIATSFGAGTSQWIWLSAITFSGATADVVFSAAIAGSVSVGGLTGSITQPIIWNLWYTGATWQTSATGTQFLYLTGHAFTTTNTLTIQAAPGQSFRDKGSGTTLAFNAANGVSFTLPSANAGANYFQVNDPNVKFNGLQWLDPGPTTSDSTILNINANNCSVRNCILDGATQTGGAFMIDIGVITVTGTLFTNTLIVNRAPAGANQWPCVKDPANTTTSATFVNCTFIAINAQTGTAALIGDSTVANSWTVRNCVSINYSQSGGAIGILNVATPASGYIDHCGTDATSIATSGGTDNGGELVSQTIANMFVSSTTDFRLKTGSPFIGTGVVDTTNIPTADDIFGTARGVAPWDMGCYEFPTAAYSFSATATISTIKAVATATNPVVAPSTWNGSDKDSAVTLSSGNTIATTNAITQTGVRTTTSNTSGKYYAEFTLKAAASNKLTMGIATAAWSFTDTNGLGGNTTSMGIIIGAIYTNNAIVGMLLNNTATPGKGQVTDGGGNVWTVSVGGEALENGLVPTFSSNVANIYYISGVVYQVNQTNQWYYFTQTSPNVGTWTGTGNQTPPNVGMVNGSVYGMAVDLTARSVWWRLNNGLWNASGTANPDTGVGGFPLTGLLSNALFGAMGDVGTVGDSVLFTGSAPFAYTKPTTFQQWDFIPTNNATASASIGPIGSVISAQFPVPAAGISKVGTVSAVASAGQSDRASSTNTISTISAVASAQFPIPASAKDTLSVISSVAGFGQSNRFSATDTLSTISAVATGQIPVLASATATLSPAVASASFGQSNLFTATVTVSTVKVVASGQNASPSSAISTIGVISAVASFGQSVLCLATNTLSTISGGASAQSPIPASGTNTLGTISAIATGQIPVMASAIATLSQVSSVANFIQSDIGTATNTLGTIGAIATAQFPVPISGVNTVGSLSSVASFGHTLVATVADYIAGISCVASMGTVAPATALVSIPSLAAHGIVYLSNLAYTPGSSIQISATIIAGSANGVTALGPIPSLRASAVAVQSNLVRATLTIALQCFATGPNPITSVNTLSISAAGVLINPDNAVVISTISNIGAVASASQYTLATGIGTIVIRAATIVNPSQAIGTIGLRAIATYIGTDGITCSQYITGIEAVATAMLSNIAYTPGVALPALTSNIAAGFALPSDGLANLPTVTATIAAGYETSIVGFSTLYTSATIQAGQSQLATSVVSLPAITATMVAGEETLYSATISFPTLRASVAAVQLTGIGVTATIPAIRAAATMSSYTSASGRATIPSMGATIVAGGIVMATGLATCSTLSAKGTVVPSVLVNAHPSIGPITASVQAGQSNLCVAKSSIVIGAASTVANPLAVWAVVNFGNMTAQCVFGQEAFTVATAILSEVFVYSTARQDNPASTASTIAIAASGTALQINNVSATISLPKVACSATFIKGWLGSAQATLPTLSASATAVLTLYPIAAVDNIPTLNAVALFGGVSLVTASATLGAISCAAIVTESNLSSVTATIPSLHATGVAAITTLAFGNAGIIWSAFGTAGMEMFWNADTNVANIGATGGVYAVPPAAIGEEVVYFDTDDRLVYYEDDRNVYSM